MRKTKTETKTVEVETEVVVVEMTVAQAALIRALIGPLPSMVGLADLYSVYLDLGNSLRDGEFIRIKTESREQPLSSLRASDFTSCFKY